MDLVFQIANGRTGCRRYCPLFFGVVAETQDKGFTNSNNDNHTLYHFSSYMMNTMTLCDMAMAIELNNQGAQLIRFGRCDEAAALLLDAVRQFREGKQYLVSVDHTHSRSSQRTTITKTRKTQRKCLLDEYVYAIPFHLENTRIEPRLIQISIIFNFAIARHLRALTSHKSKRERRLRTTLKLYNWVLSLERSIKEGDSLLGLLPCLGLINNCAQIHRQLNKEDKAEKMFGILLSSLMVVKERGERVDVEDLAGFYSSISHLILKRSNVARAA